MELLSSAKQKMSDDDASCCCVCVCVLVVCVIMVLPVYRPLSFYPRLDSAVLAALDHSVTPPPDSTDALRLTGRNRRSGW